MQQAGEEMNLFQPEVSQFRGLLSTVMTSPWHKSTKKSKQTMKRLKQIFRRLFICSLFGHKTHPDTPPDNLRSPEDLRRDALVMAREWQAELQEWMETLKRHAT